MNRDLFLAQEALPVETIPQRFEAFFWFLRRRPAAPLTFMVATAFLVPFIVLSYASATARASWPAAALLALGAVVSTWLAMMLLIGMVWFWHASRPSVTIWATKDARLGIWVRSQGNKPGWYAAEHIARPGAAGAGREIRLLLNDALHELGDREGVALYASTRSKKLADRYCEDITGLRIVRKTWWGQIELERPPRGEWPSSDAL